VSTALSSQDGSEDPAEPAGPVDPAALDDRTDTPDPDPAHLTEAATGAPDDDVPPQWTDPGTDTSPNPRAVDADLGNEPHSERDLHEQISP
jgi:hypothetical protein